MKKIVLLATIILSINSMYGQTAAVIAAFKQKFPSAEKAHWEKEKNGNFEAHFKLNGNSMSADFSPTGEWLETESGIPVSDLPTAVVTAFKKEHGAATIKAADKIEKAKAVSYEIEYKDGLKTKEVVYDAEGVVQK